MRTKQISKLSGHDLELHAMREAGASYREIAERLGEEHGVTVSHNAVYSYLKVRERRHSRPGLFYEGLPEDIKLSLLKQFSVLWTHGSTAIEGNTLTLGETANVMELGLTISGKPLKDHEEVYGHARAIDLVMDLLGKERIDAGDLLNLHRCVMHKSAIDSQRPVGSWKRDYNGTTGVRDGKPIYMEYSSPSDTPALMRRWTREFSRKLKSALTQSKAINVYCWAHLTFVRIHPFFDGNGRVARLIANLPLLKCGHPPLLIAVEKRAAYINALWEYQTAVGVLKADGRLLAPHPSVHAFKTLLREEWRQSQELMATAHAQASERESR